MPFVTLMPNIQSLFFVAFATLCLMFQVPNAVAAGPVKPANTKPIMVKTMAVSSRAIQPRLDVVAYLSAEQGIVVAPQISGRIAEFAVGSNQKVEKGQLLVRIDDAESLANVAEAQAYLSDEQRKLAELKRLIHKGAVTQSEIDAQQASVAMAQAQLQRVQAQLDYHYLRAPFAGTVGLIDHSVGALVDSGDSLMSLDSLSTLRLDLAVPERYLAQLYSGLTVSATAKSWPSQQFNGVIEAVDPHVSKQSLNLKVRVRFENPEGKLKPGMMLAATLEFDPIEEAVIPVQALEYSGTKRFVYVVDNESHAQRREVTLGERVETQVAIRSGIDIGERIVVEGIVNIKPGATVTELHNDSSEVTSKETEHAAR